ncbi:uncharacterized protein METZ01_LOCUS164789 [marine metagenome]|uniref:Peptide-N-glycosidase F N-terminal domain-containing protein n=1 Tax=marine metagenome TaxID=408172 RepID=A0A382BDN7_9ZZZZ
MSVSRMILRIAVFFVSIFTLLAADTRDFFIVNTFNEEFVNWATPHVQTFEFPSDEVSFSSIELVITLACPSDSGDCDPWDRLGHITVLHETGETDTAGSPVTIPYEIARFITPYDITGEWGGESGPGSCAWSLDMTAYESILRDSVTLSLYISTWMGNNNGWLITADFIFTGGFNLKEPYRIVNLYRTGYLEIGNPDNPVENFLVPKPVWIDTEADSGYIRVVTTGHGFGNTDNAAEFSYLHHTVKADDAEYIWSLWRPDCAQNECSPQGGTWIYPRAGWCPGDKVTPTDWSITPVISPGDSMLFDYDLEDYFNCCRTSNPDCTGAPPCCVYNGCGENTMPNYVMSVQLILLRNRCQGWNPGDLNRDNTKDIFDLLMIADMVLVGESDIPCYNYVGDVNENGIVDLGDVIGMALDILNGE